MLLPGFAAPTKQADAGQVSICPHLQRAEIHAELRLALLALFRLFGGIHALLGSRKPLADFFQNDRIHHLVFQPRIIDGAGKCALLLYLARQAKLIQAGDMPGKAWALRRGKAWKSELLYFLAAC